MNKTKFATLAIIALFIFSSVSYFAFAKPEAVTSNVGGFHNAVLKSTSAVDTQFMEVRMVKIQTQTRDKLNAQEGLQFQFRNQEMIASFENKAKLFGFIQATKTYEYKIADDGAVTRNRRWWEFMWSEDSDPILNG